MTDQIKKKRLPRYTTPAGIAVFPRLTSPDFKFKKDHGEYSVKLRLSEADATPIIKRAEAVIEESYQEQVEAHKGKKDKKGKPIEINKAEASYTVEMDDNGNPTGHILIAFKMNGGYTDKKTGQKVERTIPLFDAAGKPCKADIWGGSKLKVAYQLAPYFAAADLKAGVSFRLDAVQVIELVTKGGGNASSYGFAQEEGFVAEKETETFDTEEGATDAAAGAASGGDF